MKFEVIAFDADDTLWHNETHYIRAKNRFSELLSCYHEPDRVLQILDENESLNVSLYGYGTKSFVLSMIETAIELSNGEVTGYLIREILALGRQMLSGEVQLFEHAGQVVAELSSHHNLMLITKGDAIEQARKIEKSGLAQYFRFIEIVADKTTDVYRTVLNRYRIDAARFLMVGNSLRSDILPVLEIGGQAVYIPYEHTWAHELTVEGALAEDGYYELEHLGQLPALVRQLSER